MNDIEVVCSNPMDEVIELEYVDVEPVKATQITYLVWSGINGIILPLQSQLSCSPHGSLNSQSQMNLGFYQIWYQDNRNG